MEEQEESIDTEISVLHIESVNCQCPECVNNRKCYIQIIDVDNYVNAFTEHYTILGSRYSYNEKLSIVLIVDSVRWLMIGSKALCSSIKEIVEKS